MKIGAARIREEIQESKKGQEVGVEVENVIEVINAAFVFIKSSNNARLTNPLSIWFSQDLKDVIATGEEMMIDTSHVEAVVVGVETAREKEV